MKRLLFANLAVLATGLAAPAPAADLPLEAPAPFAARFDWTSCYVGGHLGGGLARKEVMDPVQLVQDALIAPGASVGATTLSPTANGLVVGGQIGCDYQFSSALVFGVEGAASGATMKGTTTIGLPLGSPDTAVVKANTEFLSSVTARLGYAAADVLVYVKSGVALVSGKYEVTGTIVGTPFSFTGFDNRLGWTAGGGVDWAFTRQWSANIEYDYYRFGRGNVLLSDPVNDVSGLIDVRQSIHVVKLGLNFHIWGAGL